MTQSTARVHAGRRMFHAFLLAVLILGSLFSGYFFFSTVRAVAARAATPIPIPPAAGGEQGEVPEQTTPEPTPVAQEQQQKTPEVAKKQERVNILLLGIDKRPQEIGSCRTDSMILVSIDPANNTASMLSIPRDLWVKIPGYGEDRINVAHFLGDARKLPGGGPGLAKKTVSSLFGVPVQHYVRINFAGFEKLVDAIGGVDINVEKRIYDTTYPDNNYGFMTVDIPAGMQHMDGQKALQYARSRHMSTGDFDRMARQQQVILAARNKVMGLDIPLTNIPQLLQALGDSVQTDLSLDKLIEVADMVRKLDSANIRHEVIDNGLTTPYVTAGGAAVELPNWPRIRKLMADLFPPQASTSGSASSLSNTGVLTESARISLQNGTRTIGIARTARENLRRQGFNIVRYETADRTDYAQTVIIDYANKQQTVSALATLLDVKPENIRQANRSQADVDIVAILGQDYLQRAGQN